MPFSETSKVPTYRLAPADRNHLVSSFLSLSKLEVFSIFKHWPLGEWKIGKSQWTCSGLGAHIHEHVMINVKTGNASPHGKACPSAGVLWLDLQASPDWKLNMWQFSTLPDTPAPAPTTPFQKIIKFHATKSKEYRLSFFSLKNNLHLRETSFGFCFILVSWKFTMHFSLLWCLYVLNNQPDQWCRSGVLAYFLYHPEFFKGSIWIFHIFSSLWGLTYNKFSPTHTNWEMEKWIKILILTLFLWSIILRFLAVSSTAL